MVPVTERRTKAECTRYPHPSLNRISPSYQVSPTLSQPDLIVLHDCSVEANNQPVNTVFPHSRLTPFGQPE